MDVLRDVSGGPPLHLLFLNFLSQTDCKDAELQRQLVSLSGEMGVRVDFSSKSPRTIQASDDGDLETDGHIHSSLRGLVGDMRPQVQLEVPGNPAEAEAVRAVSAELRQIAEQFEHNVVTQATGSLYRKIKNTPMHMWRAHMTLEVEWIMRNSPASGLEHLPQERVVVALTFTLVKRVCEQAPLLLRNLFHAALQYLVSFR